MACFFLLLTADIPIIFLGGIIIIFFICYKYPAVCIPGIIFFVGGIVLIGVSTNLPSGDYFLIGPFCIAAGTILFIRGCINKLAKRQHRREQVSAAACYLGRSTKIAESLESLSPGGIHKFFSRS